MAVRVTQTAVQVLYSPPRSTAKITQTAGQILYGPPRPSVKITQSAILVLHDDTTAVPIDAENAGSVRSTSNAFLSLEQLTVDARVTQGVFLALSGPPVLDAADTRNTQSVFLVLTEELVSARTTQSALLALADSVPCITKWAQTWTITRTDAQVFAFTSLDSDIMFRGVSHKACDSLSATATEMSAALASTGNMELEGLISDSSITALDLYRGLFDGATVEVWVVPWENTEGEIPFRLLAGTIGNVEQKLNSFTAEIITPAAIMQQRPLLEVYTPSCRFKLGDSRCTIDLSTLELTGSVTALLAFTGPNAAARRVFVDSARTEVARFYENGELTWTSGDNIGLTSEIKDFDGTSFVLWAPVKNAIVIGDAYTIRPGCDKSTTACTSKFSNFINFGGFPHVPGDDRLFQTPDAK